MLGLDESQAGIKTAREKFSTTSDMQMISPYGRNQRGTKEPLDEGGREKRKKTKRLKTQHSKNKDHGIWSHHFMANNMETIQTVADFIFWAPKSLQMLIAAMKLKDVCSLEEKL